MFGRIPQLTDLERFYQDIAPHASSVVVVRVGGDWQCRAYNSRGDYVGGSSSGGDERSFQVCQNDAFQIARFITQPVVPDGDELIRRHMGFDPALEV